MHDLTSYVITVASTVSTAGILGGLAYLRGISHRLGLYEDKQFADELHLLDHEQRLRALEPRRPL